MSEMEAEKRPREEAPEFSATAAASDDLPTSKKTRAEAEPAAAQSVPALGAQDLDALAKLLAFYFSDANLRRDKFLIAEQAKTVDGWVPIRVLLTFNKVKQITSEVSHVAAAATSEAHGCKDLLAVSATGEAVRRAAGVLDTTSKDDSDQRTLFVEGFPLHVQGLVPEPTIESIVDTFSSYGTVLIVRKRRGGAGPGARHDNVPKRFLGSAFVEFKEIEAVANACAAAAAAGGTLSFPHPGGTAGAAAVAAASAAAAAASGGEGGGSDSAPADGSNGQGEDATAAAAAVAAAEAGAATKAAALSVPADAAATSGGSGGGGGCPNVALSVLPLNDWLAANKANRVQSQREAGDAGSGKRGRDDDGEDAPPPKPVYDEGKILKLTGVPTAGVTRYSIKDRFGLFGKVKYVDYNDGDESGIAFVRFDVPADAASALASLGESGWNFNDATPTSAEETGASAAADGSTTAVAAEESADSAGAAETSRDSCAAAVAVSLLAGDEEEAYWANIDAMHRQKQAQGGGKGGKGGGKGKGKGKGGKGKGRRS